MNRTERMFAIAETLRASGSEGRTTSWFAREFEVSTRTIKRDMAALFASGIPLVSFEGRGGGYQMLPATHVSPVPLTAGEAAAIAIALVAEPQMPFCAEGRSALTKLVSAMSPEQRELAASTAERVWMRRDAAESRPASASVLDDALRTLTQVHITYADASGAETERTIEPMAFARTGGHWYVLAWCHLRNGGRWFRMDRVTGAWPTRTAFIPRDLTETFGEAPDDALPSRLPV